MLKTLKYLNFSSALVIIVHGSLISNSVMAKDQYLGNNAVTSPTKLAQAQQWELSYNQMSQSMNSAFGEILPFLNALSKMENIQTDEELLAMVQQLTPVVNRITGNFSQAYQIGEQMMPLFPQGRMETEYVGTIVTLNGLGALAFSPWLEIFNSINNAYQTQNPQQLQSAIAQMPPALNKILEFANQAQSVVQQGQQLQQSSTAGSNTETMTPAQYQMYSNMSKMMHETNMNILRSISSDGEWRYNPATGKDEYSYF